MTINCDKPLSGPEMRFMFFGPITLPMLIWFCEMFKWLDWIRAKESELYRKLHYVLFFIPFAVFLIADFLYNLIVGTVTFMEWPKEGLFTSRLERKKAEGIVAERELAYKLCATLNISDPGHC